MSPATNRATGKPVPQRGPVAVDQQALEAQRAEAAALRINPTTAPHTDEISVTVSGLEQVTDHRGGGWLIVTAKADAAKAARAQAAQERAEREADLMWSRCASCGQERLLDRPITEPGALYMPHAVFLPQPHAANAPTTPWSLVGAPGDPRPGCKKHHPADPPPPG